MTTRTSTDGPYDYAREIDDAESDALRRGWPTTRLEAAEERGYVRGNDDD